MYKILFITLIVLSVSIRAHPAAETGFVDLNATAAPAPAPAQTPIKIDAQSSKNIDAAVPEVTPLSSQTKVAPRTGINSMMKLNGSTKRKCPNRFDYSGYQVDINCVKCANGTHTQNGKCVSNATGCTKKALVDRTDKAKVTIGGNCVKCNFWQWTTVNDVQGNYCTNRWWMWVIIFLSAIIGLALLVSAISFFTCCDDCCSKKQSSKSSKGRGGEVNVQNKKPSDKKKSSGGCCGCGGDKKKKSQKEESYDRGYSKPGFCDCMPCATTCGGCFAACGCTCSKCCKKQGKYVSGYGLADRY